MRKLHYLLFALFLGLSVSITSCSDDDDDTPPTPVGPELPTTNKTINEIKALAVENEFTEITQDFIIEGVVISSDEDGNFYKAVWLQDTKAGGEGGIYLKINKGDLYNDYAVGQKVIVKCQNLELEIYGGQPSLGVSYTDSEGNLRLGGIDEADVDDKIFKDGEPTTLTPTTVAIDAITDAMVGTLIKIDAVQFKADELSNTYAIDEQTTNRTITDANRNEIIVRTSGYADFKGETVAQQSGSITAILTKYESTYQLVVRNLDDIVFDQARFEVAEPPFTPVTLDEMDQAFTSGTVDTRVDIDGWYTENTQGEKYWEIKTFSDNNYLNIAGYNSNQDAMVSWLVTPGLNLDAASSNQNFTFESKRGFTKAETLEVLVSSDFDPTQGVEAATWEALTVTLPEANTSGYTSFVSAGDIDLSAKSGVVYVAFKYTGNQTDATGTWQIDNVQFNYTPSGDVPTGDDTDGTIYANVENFDNAALTSSYADGNFVGANNITWTYVGSRDHNGDANGSGIQGNAIMLRREASDSKITSSTISGGINKFTVKMYKGFTGAGDRQIEVFINGNSIGTSVTFDDLEKHECTFENLNISGDFTIEIRNITAKQVIIDDISWE